MRSVKKEKTSDNKIEHKSACERSAEKVYTCTTHVVLAHVGLLGTMYADKCLETVDLLKIHAKVLEMYLLNVRKRVRGMRRTKGRQYKEKAVKWEQRQYDVEKAN